MDASLVLFDIDGTLTRGVGPHHLIALEQAIREVTGIGVSIEGIPVHGMLDRVILTLMLERAGIAGGEAERVLPAVIDAAQEKYHQIDVPDLTDKRTPGVPEVLEELGGRGTVLALVTGNLTRIGWRKLSRAGIHHHFRFGAFGEMGPTRGALAKLAVARARSEGMIGPRSKITHIGDAVSDVQAAHDAGIQSIAVRTGITPLEDLIAARPDLLLDDLTALDLSFV